MNRLQRLLYALLIRLRLMKAPKPFLAYSPEAIAALRKNLSLDNVAELRALPTSSGQLIQF